MPFLTGRTTFSRFRCDEHLPYFDESHLERLRSAAEPAVAGPITTTWCGGEHVLDREFTLLKNVYPDRLHFEYREVTDRPPAELLKAYYATDLKALAANNPSGYPSARQKREAKQSAYDRLEQEAKDGRFLRRKCTPVLWDAKLKTVFFGSTSAAAQTRFWELFEKTFELKLTPITAGRLCGPTGESTGFYPEPSRFIRDVHIDGVAWSPDDQIPDWLGNEFVMWLWWRTDAISDTISLPCGDTVLMFSGGGKLECPRGVTGNDTLNHDSFVRMREARSALRSGKWPRQVAITVVCRGDQFSLKLQPETMAVSSCKLPEVDAEITENREREIARLDQIRDLVTLLDEMFEQFMSERRNRIRWGERLAMIQAWILDRRSAA